MEKPFAITKEIEALHALESKARKLRNQLDVVETAWESKRASIEAIAPVNWAGHCEARGFHPRYTFSDCLA